MSDFSWSPARPDGRDAVVVDLRPWRAPGLGLAALGAGALAFQSGVGRGDWAVPLGVVAASGLILLPALLRALRGSTASILANHLLFFVVAYVLYFVLGSLLIPYGPVRSVAQASAFYPVDPAKATRVAGLNCLGMGAALLSAAFARRRLLSGVARRIASLGRSIPAAGIASGFLLVGGTSFFYVWISEAGLYDGVVPGLVHQSANLLTAAILLAAAYRGKGSVLLTGAAVALALAQALAGLVLLNKSMMIMPILALMGGLSWRYGLRRVWPPGFALLAAMLAVLSSPINDARNRFGSSGQFDVGRRLIFLADGALHPGRARIPDDYSLWARFCYVSPGVAAVDFHDAGLGSDDYRRLGWVFLPRFLFPNKPIITAQGEEFSFKVSKNGETSTGVGLFVDGYYNLGTKGTILAGLFAGWMLAMTSTLAAEVISSASVLWLPLAMLGNLIAVRIDGAFLNDYWGPFALFVYILAAGTAVTFERRGASAG